MSNWNNINTNFTVYQIIPSAPINAAFNDVMANFNLLPDPLPSGSTTKGFTEPCSVGVPTDASHAVRADGIQEAKMCSVSGTADAIVLTSAIPKASYTDGMVIKFKPTANNTGSVTVNVDGLGTVPLKDADGNDLDANDLVAGNYAEFTYNGSSFLSSNMLPGDRAYIDSKASAAATSAANAATSETNAATSEADAKQWAIGAPSEPAEHSAKYWAQLANIIYTGPSTLYLSPTGNDTTGDGSHASPWFSINRAMDYLKDKILSTYVTIYVNDGFYNFTETQVVSHPYADKITILGSNQNLNATMVFASGGTWDICLHINNCNGLKIKNFLVGSTDYSKGIALEIDNSIVTVGTIGAQSAMEGLRCKNSYLESISGTSIVTLGQTLYGLHFISSTAVLHTVNCSDPTDNMNFGVTVEKGSALTVTTDATVHDCKDHAFQAHTGSKIMLTGTLSLGNNANDSTPVRTTGTNTAPNFGNYGSFIMTA